MPHHHSCRSTCTLSDRAAPPGSSLSPQPPERRTHLQTSFFFKGQSYVDSRMKCYLSFGRCNVQKFVGKLVLGVVPVEFNYGKPSRRLHLGAVHRDLPGLTGHPLLGGHYATERGTNRNTKPHRHPEHNKKSFKMSNKTLVSRF